MTIRRLRWLGTGPLVAVVGAPGAPGKDGASTIGGVAGLADALDSRVRTDAAQSFSSAQQALARANIGAIAPQDLTLAGLPTGSGAAVTPIGMVENTDCSAQIQAAIDLVSGNPATGRRYVQLPAGTFIADNIRLRLGTTLLGFGQRSTRLLAKAGSTNPMIRLAVGPVVNVFLSGIMLVANGNPGQHCIYMEAQPQVAAPYNGGLWYSAFRHLYIDNFDGYGVWLRAGTDGQYLTPHQFLQFDNVVIQRSASETSRCFVATGQVNQLEFLSCNFDGKAIGTGTNIEMSREWLNNGVSGPASIGGAPVSAIGPKVASFHVLTSQRAERAILLDAVRSVGFTRCWFEQLYRGIEAQNSCVGFTVDGSHFANAASDGSGGGFAVKVGVTSMGVGHGNEASGAFDKLIDASQADHCSIEMLYQGFTTAPTVGVGRAVAIVGNDLATRGYEQVVVSTPGTIKTITSYLLPPKRITITANVDGVLIDASSTAQGKKIYLGRWQLLTLNKGESVDLARSDTLGGFLLVGTSGLLAQNLQKVITAPPANPLVETAYDVTLGAYDPMLRQGRYQILGKTTAGTPGTGADAASSYKNAVELTPDYLFLYNESGWNNGPGNSGRTAVIATRRKIVHNGDGDGVAFNASVRITSAKLGVDSWLDNPAGVILNGSVIGEVDGVYANPFELLLKDTNGSTASFTASTTTGSSVLTSVSGTLRVGDAVSGPGIPSGTYVGSRDTVAATAGLLRLSNYVEGPALVTATGSTVTLTRLVSNTIACIGLVVNLERNRSAEPSPANGGTGLGEIWHGLRVQARGTRPVDTIVSAIGKAYTGVDFSAPYLAFENNAAFAVKQGMRYYFNATGLGVDDATGFVRDNHRMTAGWGFWHGYDASVARWQVVVNGSTTLQISENQVTVGDASAPKGLSVTGDAVIAAGKALYSGSTKLVGARSTGFGQMTGTADKTAIATYTAPTASATYDATQVQTLMAAAQQMSRRLKAIDDALGSYGGINGLLGT